MFLAWTKNISVSKQPFLDSGHGNIIKGEVIREEVDSFAKWIKIPLSYHHDHNVYVFIYYKKTTKPV